MVKESSGAEVVVEFGGEDVVKVRGCMESLNPKRGGEGCMGEESKHDFVQATNHPLRLPILLRRMGA